MSTINDCICNVNGSTHKWAKKVITLLVQGN